MTFHMSKGLVIVFPAAWLGASLADKTPDGGIVEYIIPTGAFAAVLAGLWSLAKDRRVIGEQIAVLMRDVQQLNDDSKYAAKTLERLGETEHMVVDALVEIKRLVAAHDYKKK